MSDTETSSKATVESLLQKIKFIQDQNPYRSINDMEINKYYKIKKATYGMNRYKKQSMTVTIEEDGDLYDLILPPKFKFNDEECKQIKKHFEIGVKEEGKNKRREFEFREKST